MIRVFVVDDHALVRIGLSALVDAESDMECAGQAADGRDALKSMHESESDIALIDLEMPNCDGLKTIEFIRDGFPTLKAIAVSAHQEIFYVDAARNAGAAAFVAKYRAEKELIETIRNVHAGGDFVSMLGAELPSVPLRPPVRGQTTEILSKREREVLELLVVGYTNREISTALDIGTKSVETYRSRVTQKVGYRTRAELVRYAAQAGLLQSLVREFPNGDW